MKNDPKYTVISEMETTETVIEPVIFADVIVSFGIFKLRDLVLVKDCYKKT
jgi:hypothetical protein